MKNKIFIILLLSTVINFFAYSDNCKEQLTGKYHGGIFTTFYGSFNFESSTGYTTLQNSNNDGIEVKIVNTTCEFKMSGTSLKSKKGGSSFPKNVNGTECDLTLQFENPYSPGRTTCSCIFKNRGIKNLSVRNFIKC